MAHSALSQQQDERGVMGFCKLQYVCKMSRKTQFHSKKKGENEQIITGVAELKIYDVEEEHVGCTSSSTTHILRQQNYSSSTKR